MAIRSKAGDVDPGAVLLVGHEERDRHAAGVGDGLGAGDPAGGGVLRAPEVDAEGAGQVHRLRRAALAVGLDLDGEDLEVRRERRPHGRGPRGGKRRRGGQRPKGVERVEGVVGGHGVADPAGAVGETAVGVPERRHVAKARCGVGRGGAKLFQRAHGGPGVGDVVEGGDLGAGLPGEAAARQLAGAKPGDGIAAALGAGAEDTLGL